MLSFLPFACSIYIFVFLYTMIRDTYVDSPGFVCVCLCVCVRTRVYVIAYVYTCTGIYFSIQHWTGSSQNTHGGRQVHVHV